MRLGLFTKASFKETIYRMIRDNAGDGMLDSNGKRMKANLPDMAISTAIRVNFPKKKILIKKIASWRKKINRGKFTYETVTKAPAPAIPISEYDAKGKPIIGTTGVRVKKEKAKTKTVVKIVKKTKKSTPARTKAAPEEEIEQA